MSQYLLINFLRRFSEVSLNLFKLQHYGLQWVHIRYLQYFVLPRTYYYIVVYTSASCCWDAILIGQSIFWLHSAPWSVHLIAMQPRSNERGLSSGFLFFFRELLWFMLFYLHPYWRHSSLRCQLSELPAACKWQQIKNLTASLCCQSTASKTCIALESCYIIVLASHRMHRVHICGLLLPMFRGLCFCLHVRVCISVEHKHEPYRNGLTNRDAVWNVDSGGPKKRSGGPDPKEKDNFRGISRPTEKRDIRLERKLFGRWQQRCGRSLSVLQQLVYLNVEWTAEMRTVMMTIKTRTTTM